MALQYRLVQRKDMRKGAAADSKLVFAASHTTGKVEYEELVDSISTMSSASRGDIGLILDSLLLVMQQRLKSGSTVRLGALGLFRICFGSKGVENEEEFNVSLINRPKIVFRPGTLLDGVRDKNKFERAEIKTVTVTEECTKEHLI